MTLAINVWIRTDLWDREGEIPPRYTTQNKFYTKLQSNDN
jgi:hypothetical protein